GLRLQGSSAGSARERSVGHPRGWCPTASGPVGAGSRMPGSGPGAGPCPPRRPRSAASWARRSRRHRRVARVRDGCPHLNELVVLVAGGEVVGRVLPALRLHDIHGVGEAAERLDDGEGVFLPLLVAVGDDGDVGAFEVAGVVGGPLPAAARVAGGGQAVLDERVDVLLALGDEDDAGGFLGGEQLGQPVRHERYEPVAALVVEGPAAPGPGGRVGPPLREVLVVAPGDAVDDAAVLVAVHVLGDPLVAVSLARNPRVVGGPVTGPLEGGVEQVGFRPADGGEEVGVALAFVAVDGDAVVDAADGDGVGGVTVVAEAARAESAALVARGFAA